MLKHAITAAMVMTLLVACSPPETTAPAKNGAGIFDILLTPRLGDNKVEAIDVEISIPEPGATAGEPFLSMAIVRVMAPSALGDPASLTAEDDLGVIPMTIEEDPADPSEFRQDRRWIPSRTSEGDVMVRYSIEPRVITASTRPGPLIDTRTELWGVYGSGNTMLALPVNGWPRHLRVRWDLSEMPKGARAATSLGEGTAESTVTLQNINNSFFMAGPLKSQPKDGAGAFVVYWMTPPAFDLQGAAAWAEEAYRYFADFFGKNEAAFRVFMRTTERFQGGGGGGFNSFIFGTVEGEDRDPKEVRSLLAHEAIHHFVGGYGEGGGAGGQQWYSEGATSYYTVVLPYRAGLTSLEDFIGDFNDHALNYYTNPKSGLSNVEVTRLFFSDHNAQLVPYNRGPLYFASLDAKMRAASNGEKRVDDLIFRFIEERDNAEDGPAFWREVVVDALGEEGGADFDAMMNGAPLDLDDNLFGACYTAEEKTLQNYALGFRPYKDETGATRIGPVTPGSPAESAGLQRYDYIENPATLDAVREGEPGGGVTLDIVRDGATQTVTFTPWTPPVTGKQWVRTSVPENQCAL